MAFGSNGGFKTGQLIEFAGNAAPDGFLPCNGAAVSRTTYAALFNVIGTIWGAGDGSTTFNIPNFINKFVKGSSTSGTVNAETLPNIRGSIIPNGTGFLTQGTSANTTGALSVTKNNNRASSGGSDSTYNIFLNANASSSVYQDGAKVQPDNATVLICIKY